MSNTPITDNSFRICEMLDSYSDEIKCYKDCAESLEYENIALRERVKELEKDKARLDWLSQCTVGEWEELNNVRLSHRSGYLREAIDKSTEAK